MFELDVSETLVMLEKFDTLCKQIDLFKSQLMPDEVWAWQTQDLHRRYPNLTTVETGVVEMSMHPSPRPRTAHTYGKLTKTGKTRKPMPPRQATTHRRRVTGPKPPILRTLMFDYLDERMVRLMQAAMLWPSQV